MQEPLDILQKVQRAEAPPFLLTRIEAKIDEVQKMKLTPKFAIAVCSVFILVLSINFYILNSSSEEQSTPSVSYSETSLSPEYKSLY